MTDFIEALEEKIRDLQMRKDELEEEIGSIDTRIDVLRELLVEEEGSSVTSVKKSAGRPRGSKNKKSDTVSEPKQSAHLPSDDILREASTLGGTDPEVAERLKNRFRPTPRPHRPLGPGISVGGGKVSPGQTKSDATISDVGEGD
jgi:chromosome segregation ATPase